MELSHKSKHEKKFYIGEPEDMEERACLFIHKVFVLLCMLFLFVIVAFIATVLLSKTPFAPSLQKYINAIEYL